MTRLRMFRRGAWLLLFMATGAPAADFTIRADSFDDGNVRVSLHGQAYAGGESCIWNGGELPNWAEYVVEVPVTADYTLWASYAALQPRPVQITLDSEGPPENDRSRPGTSRGTAAAKAPRSSAKQVHTGFKGTTGDWNTRSARWERQCVLQLARGTHTIRLECQGPMPHICALRLESSVPFPDGCELRRLSEPERAARARAQADRARVEEQIAALEQMKPEALLRAIDDLGRTFPDEYDAARHRQALVEYRAARAVLLESLAEGKPVEPAAIERLLSRVRAALLANPLLDFDRLLVVRRSPAGSTGFVPTNYLTHTAIPPQARENCDNEIAVLSNLRGTPRLDMLYKPARGQLLRDVRLDFPADRLLFSSIDAHGRWAIFSIRSDGGGLAQLTPTRYPDLDYYDACWLPDGRIVLGSTGSYTGLPCLNGKQQITSLYLLDPATKALRQLTFDQDSDNDPTVLNDGRVLYQRWEYSDIPHYFSRRRMTMNPDGTGQLALYGSNSWFPTAFRFARPVPDHPSRLVGIISGHHDHGDCGRLAILDPGLAGGYPFRYRPKSKEWGVEGEIIAVTPDVLPARQTGFLQLIPGHGRPVAGTVCDAIITHHYLEENPSLTTHPHPLSSNYFLVSMKPTPRSLWGIYLVDVFDNVTLIAEVPGSALFEPQPFVPRRRPAVIPDRIRPQSLTAEVHIADVYRGPGLGGVPRGTVKSLRVFSYHFGYNNKAGFPLVGTQAGWDMKRVIGTAAVESDGSACFPIPANTPISLQPLDAQGRAVQLMRSWLVGMPGEHVSCVGCHEDRRESLPLHPSLANQRGPQPLEAWYGPPRPFAFAHEVYPVLERYCVGCHDGKPEVGPRSKPSFTTPDLAYDTLHPYVHRPGVEADMAMLNAMEYHASTSPLVQMLEKGHHGVTLAGMDREACRRLYCWIDLNVPKNGSWNPPEWQECDQRRRRLELATIFANNDTDPEGEFLAAAQAFTSRAPIRFNAPPPEEPLKADGLYADGFPLTAAETRRLQRNDPAGSQMTIELGAGVRLDLVRIPAGEFVMGSPEGAPDERPRAVVRIARPFWMAATEITNRQYAAFDPAHDTRYIDMHSLDRVVPGHIANHPDQPVARVAWREALEFCRWLCRKTGLRFALPTEAQWEWAARAGTATQFFYGTMDTDFGRFANLADQTLRWYKMGFDGASRLQRRYPYAPEMNFPLHDERFRDGWFVVDYVGQTEENAWGLKDMVGNVSEWTRSSYRPYPYAENDGRNDEHPAQRKVARGGSWADRPADAGSAVRRAYQSWQKVYDVGFRVVIE